MKSDHHETLNPMLIKDNEILIIYNSNELKDRKALGYAKSLAHHQVKEFDINKDQFTETQIEELANRLGLHPIDLINKDERQYKEEYSEKQLSRNDLIKVLRQNPRLMITPISVYNNKAQIINSSYEFIKEDMEYINKSKG